ncbi:MAG: PD-(D/E)XK nuclease family protein, partial [Oligoflexales bacterium]|nr:PD-(D/E)XK nuclease family protein [Oligoflexales bacterium]
QSRSFASPDDKLPGGKDFGTAVHDVFEKMNWNLAEKDFDSFWLETQEIFENYLKGFFPGRKDDIVLVGRLVHSILNKNMPGTTMPLCRIKNDDYVKEADFLTIAAKSWEGRYLVGTVDALIRCDGKFYLLDWKNDRLKSYDEAFLRDFCKSEYGIQIDLYSKIIMQVLNIRNENDYRRLFGGFVYAFVRGGTMVMTDRLEWSEVKSFVEEQDDVY